MKRLSIILMMLILFMQLCAPIQAFGDLNENMTTFLKTTTEDLQRRFFHCEPIESADGLSFGWDLGYLNLTTIFDESGLKEIRMDVSTKSRVFSYKDFFEDIQILLNDMLSNYLSKKELTDMYEYIQDWIVKCSYKENYKTGPGAVSNFIYYYNEPKFRTTTRDNRTAFVDLSFIDSREGLYYQPDGDLKIKLSIIFFPSIELWNTDTQNGSNYTP